MSQRLAHHFQQAILGPLTTFDAGQDGRADEVIPPSADTRRAFRLRLQPGEQAEGANRLEHRHAAAVERAAIDIEPTRVYSAADATAFDSSTSRQGALARR